MKKITSAILALLLAASMTACGENTADASEETSVTTAAETTKLTEASTDNVSEETVLEEIEAENTETEPTEIEVVEEPVPERSELLNAVWDNLNAATSFRMTCNIKGKVPSESSDTGIMIDHTFTYTVSDNKTYLESEFRNLDTDEDAVEYAEYQSLDDNIITTLTQNGKEWADNTPKEMIRTSMILNALNSTPLVGLLANDAAIASDSLGYGKVSRNENGDYVLDNLIIENIICYSDDFMRHMFAGLIRTPALEDCLYNVAKGDTRDTGSSVVFTFDKDYNLKTMTFDAIVRKQNGYDVHGEITFDSWNSVPPISLPNE